MISQNSRRVMSDIAILSENVIPIKRHSFIENTTVIVLKTKSFK